MRKIGWGVLGTADIAHGATIPGMSRAENCELVAIAGLLHDMYAYTAGTYEDHAHKGAELARTMLDEIGVTDEKETEQICSAIYHHDDKLVIDSPFDEVLKDADVMHHTFHDPARPVKDKEKARYEKLLKGE